MKIEQRWWTSKNGWLPAIQPEIGESAQLLLVFGAPRTLNDKKLLSDLLINFPQAHILGCSTAGEILDTQVSDESLVATAIYFEHTLIRPMNVDLNQVGGSSYEAGAYLARGLSDKNLVHVFTLSDGIRVNGSDLAKGLMSSLPSNVSVTGGLAGDGDRFDHTIVLGSTGEPEEGIISAVGFYGNRLHIGYGSVGGWDPFGAERLITRSQANILYELDGNSALRLYKEYLGEHARNLPASGLLFPLSVRIEQDKPPVVRTILGINEKEQSLTFAGDVPEGTYARLMKANIDRLIDGAILAAKTSRETLASSSIDLAILISCVGRKLVFRQRVEEEVEGVRDIIGKKAAITGFYSYGELCPSSKGGSCDLHNQTMTITVFQER